MDWDPESLREAERVLNRGRPSGPRMDALWERIAPKVEPRRKPWWRLAGLWTLVPAVAAGVVLWVMPEAPFRARGVAAEALVEASCGSAEVPCHVGQPVFLRVVAGSSSGVASVLLVSSKGMTWLGAPVAVPPSGETALPVKVLPDHEDLEDGLSLQVFRTATALDDEQRAALLGGSDAMVPQQVLHLQVQP